MLPAFPSDTVGQIEQMIMMDGRLVSFYQIASLSGCNLCDLDPITNTSTDSYCPQCSGAYWIPTYSGWEVIAHVTWGKSEDAAWEQGGMLDNGECTVKFIYSGWMQNIIDETQYVVVDDRVMDITRQTLRGVPTVNRVIVNLKEREK